ncbi:PREDICTED: uncharacterized protein LOC109581211 [Amphimedon queenslandica]|uniref:Uncharacterized protein n=1 Tax=Amphimedon queenslandica TaxID=400682 RepID=A0A1X7VU76_AMPQE|nr:PREDICTED: uncharacterized protein LOC109581211 [Amphimedon queenslandica]|eukprot:XP_019850674.1 PREDICTED: uncharacterized protein LOC109581211 [Amphimedon queenslandica]
MSALRRRSSHEIKCIVFKNNYSRLKEGFDSAGCSIKGFLYSKSVINSEMRDSTDMNKVLAGVEVKLKFAEDTWDTLLSGMIQPPLDSLSFDLETELASHLSMSPPTSLQIQSETSDRTEDSGCGGSTSIKEYCNYPSSHFPHPSDNSDISITSPIAYPANSPATSVTGHINSPRNGNGDSFTTSCRTSSLDNNDSSDGLHSSCEISEPLKADSGYESPSTKDPKVAPVTASQTIASKSEFVHAQQSTASHLTEPDSGPTVDILRHRIASLEMKNNHLRFEKKQVIDEIKDLEEDNSLLSKGWKDDQQLLEFKCQQVARDNEILERKQEDIRRLMNANQQLKKELRDSLSQQSLLAQANEELSCRIQLAERSTSLSAITIDHLKQDIADRDKVIEDLRKEVLSYRNWYSAFSESCKSDESTSELKDTYLSLLRTENS